MKPSIILESVYGIIFGLALIAYGIPWYMAGIIWIITFFVLTCIGPELDKG
jgi:hypothetical protein